MHFCIPVSQQRLDALGGHYVVRQGPGADWARRGHGGAGAHLVAHLSRDGMSLCLQLYSVYLDGFLFCRVRYSQLHRWNDQVSSSRAGTSPSI